MRKALFPMIASLALCGAAIAALIATNARAEQGGRKPVMLALVTPNKESSSAAPRPEGDAREEMTQPRREQVCKFLYARKAGELAFLEAKLSLSTNQAPLFARWKQASLDVAKQHESDCSGRTRPAGKRFSVVDRLALEENLLKRRLSDIQAERPALGALYAALTPAQKQEFGQDDPRRMAGRMHMVLGMTEHPGMGRGSMGPGPMGRGPVGAPPELPPPPQ